MVFDLLDVSKNMLENTTHKLSPTHIFFHIEAPALLPRPYRFTTLRMKLSKSYTNSSATLHRAN